MARIPFAVLDAQLALDGQILRFYLTALGWTLINVGKVRDSYTHTELPGRRLLVATNRVSIFDFVLNALVPDKGAILTAISHSNTLYLEREIQDFRHHMLPLSEALPFLGDHCPLGQCTLVREYTVQEWEIIGRARLGGSVWEEYERNWDNGWSSVAGQAIPGGLPKWGLIPVEGGMLFTPSTKAKVGKDENKTADDYFKAMGEVGQLTVANFTRAFTATRTRLNDCGLEMYDAKAEYDETGAVMVDACFGFDEIRSGFLADAEQAIAEGREPKFYDKQQVRQWGLGVEIPQGFLDKKGRPITSFGKLDPTKEEQLAFVESLEVPADLLEQTSTRYHELFRIITGKSLLDYQVEDMGIAA